MQNEELLARIRTLEADSSELRSMVADRESGILELQLNNDMLTARLADSNGDRDTACAKQVSAAANLAK
jgi:peptidoglycan hydrolase CwlO-like protein